MSDRDICLRCTYECARCACPKRVANPLKGREDELRALAESVLREVESREA